MDDKAKKILRYREENKTIQYRNEAMKYFATKE